MKTFIVMCVWAVLSGCASEEAESTEQAPSAVSCAVTPALCASRSPLPAPLPTAVLSPPLNALWQVTASPDEECEANPDVWLPTRLQFSRYSDGSNVAFMVFDSGYSDEMPWTGESATTLTTSRRALGLPSATSTRVALEVAVWTQGQDGALRAPLVYTQVGTNDVVCTVNVLAVLER